MEIRTIPKEQVWQLRHEVLWPEREIEYVQQEDDDLGTHYGLFDDGQLISVVSLFIRGEEAQFRKFATLEAWQGKGYGSKLLTFVMSEAERKGVKRIFCNARSHKAEFYQKFGLVQTMSTFIKGGLDYIVMERFSSVMKTEIKEDKNDD